MEKFLIGFFLVCCARRRFSRSLAVRGSRGSVLAARRGGKFAATDRVRFRPLRAFAVAPSRLVRSFHLPCSLSPLASLGARNYIFEEL